MSRKINLHLEISKGSMRLIFDSIDADRILNIFKEIFENSNGSKEENQKIALYIENYAKMLKGMQHFLFVCSDEPIKFIELEDFIDKEEMNI